MDGEKNNDFINYMVYNIIERPSVIIFFILFNLLVQYYHLTFVSSYSFCNFC